MSTGSEARSFDDDAESPPDSHVEDHIDGRYQDTAEPRPERFGWLRTLQAASTRRALLLTALGGLLIAGLITALPVGQGQAGLAGYLEANPVPITGSRGNDAFNDAKAGDCLNWPDKTPDEATVVDCKDDHRFEVAESVDMRTFPGSEYGPDAAPPSPARIQQISQEQCQVAVRDARRLPASALEIARSFYPGHTFTSSGQNQTRAACACRHLPDRLSRRSQFAIYASP